MSGPDPKFPDLNNARENIDYLVCRPEPAIYQFGEELGLVATVEVAFPGDDHHHGQFDDKDNEHHDDNEDADDCDGDGDECDDDN